MHGNYKSIKLNSKGFTLIELMVTVVLIGLVLTTVYGMMTAGNRIFAQGDAKADIQSNLRVSANFISDQIRYASNVKILAAVPADMATSTNHYIYEEGGILKYYDGSTIRNVPGLLEGVTAVLQMEDNNSQSVRIQITGALKGQAYEVETAAFLLNIGSSALPAGTGSAIEFSPGIPVIANANARPITNITIKTDPEGIAECAVDGQVAFTADVTPVDASRKTVKWAFASPVSYATIESTSATTGLLKFSGAAAGESVTVYASALDGSGVLSDFPITITVTDGAIVPGTSVDVQSDFNSIFQKSGELQMIAKITPESASDLGVTWSLSGSGTATISSDGVLRTSSLNSSTGTIIVTATLSTGESDTKTIQIINNITGIQINQASASNIGGTYSGKIRCTMSPGGKSAITANGAVSVHWDVADLKKCSITHMTENSDGTLDLIVTKNKSNASFSVRAMVTPLSGEGVYSNKMYIDINDAEY